MLRATHSLTVPLTQTPESMTIGAHELIDHDAAELLDVGARADAVRACDVAQLLRVKLDAKKRRP